MGNSNSDEHNVYYTNDGWICAGVNAPCANSYPCEFYNYNPKTKLNLPCVDNSKMANCDVFYVHSFSLNKNGSNRQEIEMHCSLFNNCCQVYCPVYKHAKDITNSKEMNTAYTDIKLAFSAFCANYNHTKPFVLAGHGQGSYLLYRLIREEFMKDSPKSEDLCSRCVAAYLPGVSILVSDLKNDKYLMHTKSANDTNVIISWKTVNYKAKTAVFDIPYPLNPPKNKKNSVANNNEDEVKQNINELICLNPLSFDLDNTSISKDKNMGCMSNEGILEPSLTGAEAVDQLYVQLSDEIGSLTIESDYLPFYMNIRINVGNRVEHWLRQQKL